MAGGLKLNTVYCKYYYIFLRMNLYIHIYTYLYIYNTYLYIHIVGSQIAAQTQKKWVSSPIQ